MNIEGPEVKQSDMDLQQALWKMSVNWGNGEEMAEMIATYREEAEARGEAWGRKLGHAQAVDDFLCAIAAECKQVRAGGE